MNGFSRSVVGVVLVIVLIGTGIGVGGAVVDEHVSVEQDNGTLEVTVNQTAFGVDDPSNATIDVDINGTLERNGVEPTTADEGVNVYRIDLRSVNALDGQNLSSVNVTVGFEDGNEVTLPDQDLQYDALDDSAGANMNRGLSPDGRTVDVNGNLSGSGETNVTVFDAGADEQLAQLDDVPYRNGTVLFGEAGYELTNASYVLLFDPADEEPFAASINAGDDDAAVNAIGGGGSGLLPDLGTPVIFAVLVVFSAVTVFGLVYFVRLSSRGSGGSRATGAGSGGATSKMEVDVRVVDQMSNEQIDQPVDVEFWTSQRFGGDRSTTRRVTGRGTVTVPEARYDVTFDSDSLQASDRVSPGNQQAVLSVGPRYHKVTVEEAGSGDGIPAATVELSFPDGHTDQDRTGSEGTAGFEVPRTVDTRNCELIVDHDRYRSTTAGLTDTVVVEPLTGSARIDARLDGDPAPDVDVVLKPDDRFTRRLADPMTGTTDDEGTITVGDLPIGSYVAYLDFDDSPTVETTPVSVDVTGEEQVTETIDAEFTFELDNAQRKRIEDLYDDIEDLTPSNRDGALPYYYGNVLSSVLSTVEEFEDSCAEFLRHGVDPDDATEATIAAVDDAVAYTHTAMTNKQNVDLFSACRGLRDASVKWDGDVTVADLVAVLGDGKANHRQEMIARLESVGALLDDKQDEVSTVTPARDQYEQVREHATGLQDRSPVEQRAHFFVGLQLLDAIESTFDQPELVARLEETVF